jgi:hypothetical protein
VSQLSDLPLVGTNQPVVMVAPAGRQTVWWVIAVLLAVLTTAVVMKSDRSVLPSAWGQAMSPNQAAGARGIYAFTGQLTAKSYGLFMMDVDSGNIWCYELQHGPNGEPQMKLVAARSWIYDRFLEEFNVADPIPSVVKGLVQQQRSGQSGQSVMASPSPASPPPANASPNSSRPANLALPGNAGKK